MRHRFGGGDEVGEAHPLVGRWQLLIDGCRPDRIARSEYRALPGLCCRHRRCQDGHASLTLTEAGPEALAQRDRCVGYVPGHTFFLQSIWHFGDRWTQNRLTVRT